MDNIRTRSQTAKRFKLSVAEKGPFETLPLDIFHLLFHYLEPHNRLALAVTCKTMHAVDRYIGGWKVEHFDRIETKTVGMLYEHAIRTEPSTKAPSIPIKYRNKKIEKRIFRSAAIFQRAFTSFLEFIIDGEMNSLSFIFAFTQFEQLSARLRSEDCDDLLKAQSQSDSATQFLATLLKRQEHSDIEVDIEWKFCDHSFGVFRESLTGLESLSKIQLDWEESIQEDYMNRDYPIDDISLRHVVEKARECGVGLANISARCILDVFEICFNSTDREKKVELLTEESIIANLRRLVRASAHLGYYWEHNERDSRLRRGDGRNCTCAIIEEPPFYPGGAKFKQSRGEGYPYRRVTISRVPPLWNARRTAF